jgi:hypothetical protein
MGPGHYSYLLSSTIRKTYLAMADGAESATLRLCQVSLRLYPVACATGWTGERRERNHEIQCQGIPGSV